jgi:hypothetical protein
VEPVLETLNWSPQPFLSGSSVSYGRPHKAVYRDQPRFRHVVRQQVPDARKQLDGCGSADHWVASCNAWSTSYG